MQNLNPGNDSTKKRKLLADENDSVADDPNTHRETSPIKEEYDGKRHPTKKMKTGELKEVPNSVHINNAKEVERNVSYVIQPPNTNTNTESESEQLVTCQTVAEGGQSIATCANCKRQHDNAEGVYATINATTRMYGIEPQLSLDVLTAVGRIKEIREMIKEKQKELGGMIKQMRYMEINKKASEEQLADLCAELLSCQKHASSLVDIDLNPARVYGECDFCKDKTISKEHVLITYNLMAAGIHQRVICSSCIDHINNSTERTVLFIAFYVMPFNKKFFIFELF